MRYLSIRSILLVSLLTLFTFTTSYADDIPPVAVFDANHNDMYRSYVNTHDITQVDTFTGNMTVRLPLLNIPSNDHLPLQVTLLFDNSLAYNFFEMFTPGYGWTMTPGLYNIGSAQYTSDPQMYVTAPTYTPIFLAPDGTRHTLYSTARNCNFWQDSYCPNVSFVSKDNWAANLTLRVVSVDTLMVHYEGTITSPDGTVYQITDPTAYTPFAKPYSVFPVATITSPNHGTVITYHYDGNNGISSISRNDGFTVTFTNTHIPNNFDSSLYTTFTRVDKMQTSDGRTWQFNYQNFIFSTNKDDLVPALTSVTLPNNTQWQFTSVTNGMVPTFNWNKLNIQLTSVTSPSGLIANFTYGNNYPLQPIAHGDPQYGYAADRLAIPYVLTKTLSSPSIPTATWTYAYDKMTQQDKNFYYTNKTTVTGPTNKIVYTFDVGQNGYEDLENLLFFVPFNTPSTGTLLDETIYDLNGNQVQDTKYTWSERQISTYPAALYICMPNPTRTDPTHQCQEESGYPTTMTAPELQQKMISRDDGTYVTNYSDYDQYGYPGRIIMQGTGAVLTRTLTYYEDPNKWIFKPQNETLADGSGGVVNTITRQFDANGNMTQQVTNGVASNYAYDASGNLISHADAANSVTTFANYVAGTPETTTDAMGGVTKRDVNTDGTVSSVTDPNNFTTSYTYDPLYRLASITPPEGLPTTLDWQDSTDGTMVTMHRGDAQTNVIYNSLGQEDTIERSDAVQNTVVNKTYDAAGNLVKQTYPYTPARLEGSISYTYDALNRMISMTDGDNYTTQYAYTNNAGSPQVQITRPNSTVINKTYRAFGEPDNKQLMEIKEGNRNTVYTRLLTGEITSITQSSTTPASISFTRNYNYDPHHYLVSETNPENSTTTYGRDIMGNMTSKQVGSFIPVTYTYDKLNRLTTTVYRDTQGQQSIIRQYDNGSRLTNVRNTSHDNNWAYTYDSNLCTRQKAV